MEILDLRTRTAREILDKEKKLHPGNGYVYYLEHLADVVEIIVTDEEARYDRLMDVYESRFEAMDRLDDGSPYNQLLQAEMLFYVGLAQVKFGTPFNGASKIYSSYRKVKSHLDKHPDFKMNLKMAGMFNIMMDFIPQSMRWITSILGVSGDAGKGMRQLMAYHDHVKAIPGLAQESVLIVNLAFKLTWQDEKGLAFMAGLDRELTDGPLVRYVWALSASFAGENELALEKLSQVDRKSFQVPCYSLDYITGRCQLNRLEKGANLGLEKYLAEYPGQDFKKDACNRLSYYYLLQGDMGKYQEYKDRVAQVGTELRDRDLEALIESRLDFVPHSGLLKARLLFDGGYYPQADSVMKTIHESSLRLISYRLENSYRQGRIYQALGKTDPAIQALKQAATDGAGQPYTFATRAALQLGMIYEERKDYTNARHWYKKSLEWYDSDHTAGSVEDKAEKGKKRVEQRL